MSETPATILVVSDRKGDVSRVNELLAETHLNAKSRSCADLEQLRAACRTDTPDLIACRIEGDGQTLTGVERLRNAMEAPPGLILLVEGAQPEDYLRAGKSAASNVVDLGLPAQFDFVIRREIENTRLRRQHREALHKLRSDHVIDDSVFERPENLDSLPPIAATIDDALARENLELLFQPILSVGGNEYDNHEIFLRILSDEGYLMPGDFMRTAERYGLMPAIDRWVVQEAILRFTQEQKKRGTAAAPLRFFVNLSLHSLVDPIVVNQIIKSISEANLPPGSFVIEVDKDTILTRLKISKSLNRSVKKMKLQFSIDHYDVSDNKLNYLKHVELDFIKLNESLVRRIHDKPDHFGSVREIVEVAHRSGIEVIASQVETARELAVLFEAGVDHIQGYLIAEPSKQLQSGVELDEVAEETGIEE
jgi:EAL domain-containing protein (putative c-di-GMP-specific phosphodiesterase class I)/CheY-like chemotaxis protein